MDEQLKKRLLGAVVLLSLAVLLIPFFFRPDSSTPGARDAGQMKDPPPKPPVAMENPITDLPPLETPGALPSDFPVTQVDSEAVAPVTPQATPVTGVEPQSKPRAQRETEKTKPMPEKAKPTPEKARVAAEKAKLAPEKAKTVPDKAKAAPERLAKLSPPPTVRTKPEPNVQQARHTRATPQDPEQVSWAVQVGSFNDKIKADILRRELQVHRFPAFVMTTRVDGKLMYRVRVGPELERAKAEHLRERLAHDMTLSGNVVGHP